MAEAGAIREVRLDLFADYRQIMVMDDLSLLANEIVTQDDVERRLAIAPEGAIIHTARNTTVPVTVRIAPCAPGEPDADCDHVTECSIDVTTGRLVVMGLMDYADAATRIALAPGPYRMRACHRGLRTLSRNGLEGDDRYELTLWPAPMAALAVLKQFDG